MNPIPHRLDCRVGGDSPFYSMKYEFESIFDQLLGLDKKNDVLKFLGFAIGGLLLMLQALIANKRANAMEDTAKAQTQANLNTEQGQRCRSV